MRTPADWHQRFRQQAGWTAELRSHLYAQAGLASSQAVLEVGCGTGAVLADFAHFAGLVCGLDIDRPNLQEASRQAPFARLVQGDGAALPFSPGSFDLSLCHYLLLWVSDPAQVIAEMARVTRPGGAVLALAEPDYGGRVDDPPPLDEVGRLQMRALANQGANPLIGRRLAALFHQAGLREVRAGVLGTAWGSQPDEASARLEWAVLAADLAPLMSAAELVALEARWHDSRSSGQHVLYVPTFYAWGRVDQARSKKVNI